MHNIFISLVLWFCVHFCELLGYNVHRGCFQLSEAPWLAGSVQGASEIVLDRCVSYFNENGTVVDLSDSKKAEILEYVTEMAGKGLRTIGLAYTDFPAEDPSRPATFFDNAPDNNLILMAIVGIKVGSMERLLVLCSCVCSETDAAVVHCL